MGYQYIRTCSVNQRGLEIKEINILPVLLWKECFNIILCTFSERCQLWYTFIDLFKIDNDIRHKCLSGTVLILFISSSNCKGERGGKQRDKTIKEIPVREKWVVWVYPLWLQNSLRKTTLELLKYYDVTGTDIDSIYYIYVKIIKI